MSATTFGGNDDDDDIEFTEMPADQLVDVFLSQSNHLITEGYSKGDVLYALNMAAADLATSFRSDNEK